MTEYKRGRAALLDWCGAILRFFVARPRLVLALAVAAPFVPYAMAFIRKGVPDVMLTGDGASLEIRTLHAARGTQLLGPYSRFHWSHPGPALFYLALPFYVAFHQHGPALSLFALVANFVAALALVLSARRIAGGLYALVVAALLAIYEASAVASDPFTLASAWNPVVTMLPLALASLLSARLAAGRASALPGFLFVASAIVQTHLGYGPVTVFLGLIGVFFYLHRRFTGTSLDAAERQRTRRAVGAAAVVLAASWALPVYENATRQPGNLSTLWKFFTDHHAPERTWVQAAGLVVEQLAVMPLAILQTFAPHIVRAPGAATFWTLALAQAGALVVIVIHRRRNRDQGVVALSMIALGEMLVAIAAVRAIFGGMAPYLIAWVSILGLVAFAALAAWLVPAATRRFGARAARVGLSALALAAIALSIRSRGVSPSVVSDPQRDTERVVRDVEAFVVSRHIELPVVSLGDLERWTDAVNLALSLYKHRIPVLFAKDWAYMVGPELGADSGEHPVLLVGDGNFDRSAHTRADLQPIAASGDLHVYLQEAGYLRKHRLPAKLSVVSATGVVGDPDRAVDGVLPEEGTPWDSPQSLVLQSPASKLEITVPAGNPTGLFLSVDANDIYAIRCFRTSGEPVVIGTSAPTIDEYGMRTRLVFSEGLDECRSIEVSPQQGDGFYSLGEIGFVTR